MLYFSQCGQSTQLRQSLVFFFWDQRLKTGSIHRYFKDTSLKKKTIKKLLSENKEQWPEYADQLAVAEVKAGFGQLHKKVSSSTKPGS